MTLGLYMMTEEWTESTFIIKYASPPPFRVLLRWLYPCRTLIQSLPTFKTFSRNTHNKAFAFWLSHTGRSPNSVTSRHNEFSERRSRPTWHSLVMGELCCKFCAQIYFQNSNRLWLTMAVLKTMQLFVFCLSGSPYLSNITGKQDRQQFLAFITLTGKHRLLPDLLRRHLHLPRWRSRNLRVHCPSVLSYKSQLKSN